MKRSAQSARKEATPGVSIAQVAQRVIEMTIDQEAVLCTRLKDRFCRSAREVRAHIATQFGLRYSHSDCLKLLRRLSFEYRKPLPHVADETLQQEFIDFYENMMHNLPADEAVYFADAVHPEYQTKPAFGWVRKSSNLALKTTTGRGRVTIHGPLCLENFDAPFVEPVTVDGESAVQLLVKIEAKNPTRSTMSRDLGHCDLSQVQGR